MSHPDTYILDFHEFTATTTVIELRPHALWFRASSRFVNGLPECPLFLSMKSTADFYLSKSNNERVMECYENPKPLRLLDVRFLQMVIPYILSNRKEPINEPTLEWYKKLCITFGGCSAARQLKLLKEFAKGQVVPPITHMAHSSDTHVSPIEPMGFRIGITNMDYDVLEVLKHLFYNIDGFIAPNNLLPEVILFYPKAVLSSIPVPGPEALSKIPVVVLETNLRPSTNSIFEPYSQRRHRARGHSCLMGRARTVYSGL